MVLVKELVATNDKVRKEIKELEMICQEHDKLKGNVFLDTSLNYNPDIKSLFLLYVDDKLVSFLSLFIPMSQEAEVSAYTLPKYRKLGYFTQLLAHAKEELNKYNISGLVFVCESQSEAGVETIRKLKGEYEFTEYYLRYRRPVEEDYIQQVNITLRRAEHGDLEALIGLSQDIFLDAYEDAKSLIAKTLEAENRIQYIATISDLPIGMISVGFEQGEASIFGFGVSPQYQGKGYGKVILRLILKELVNMDIEIITLEVDSNNQRAYNFYRNYGFEVETSYDYYRKNLQ